MKSLNYKQTKLIPNSLLLDSDRINECLNNYFTGKLRPNGVDLAILSSSSEVVGGFFLRCALGPRFSSLLDHQAVRADALVASLLSTL